MLVCSLIDDIGHVRVYRHDASSQSWGDDMQVRGDANCNRQELGGNLGYESHLGSTLRSMIGYTLRVDDKERERGSENGEITSTW